MNNLKVNKILTEIELFEMIRKVNPTIKAINYEPLHEHISVANVNQPMIKVNGLDGDWWRVYVNNEYSELEWF